MIAVIGAHPDDAEIGAGGLLAQEGGLIISITDGTNGNRDAETALLEMERAAKILDVGMSCLGLPEIIGVDMDLVTALDEVFAELGVDTVITHHPEDSNQEHAYTAQAAIAASRRIDNVLFFEGMPPSGRAPFRPQTYLDITEVAYKKWRAINTYKSQLVREGRNLIKTRKALDAWRGCELGVEYAEAYEVRRMRW